MDPPRAWLSFDRGTRRGVRWRVCRRHFGHARLCHDRAQTQLSTDANLVGVPSFSSPEVTFNRTGQLRVHAAEATLGQPSQAVRRQTACVSDTSINTRSGQGWGGGAGARPGYLAPSVHSRARQVSRRCPSNQQG